MIENPADFYYGVLWNKLYRRRIIEEHKIRMDTDISWCEDFLFNLEYIRHASSFYALKVPIYYYLKRRGSLVTQGMSISNTVRMKINIFEYYNEFYKDVYDQEDYADIRFQVYSFFFAAAKDGGVPWALLPGSKKLGEERKKICREEIEGEGGSDPAAPHAPSVRISAGAGQPRKTDCRRTMPSFSAPWRSAAR